MADNPTGVSSVERLKPCPFCGAVEQEDGKAGPLFICSTIAKPERTFYRCQDCGARGPEISFEVAMQGDGIGHEAAREAWNTRADAARIEALEKALGPFAEDASFYAKNVPDDLTVTIFCEEHGVKSLAAYTVGDLRLASSLLSDQQG